MASNAEVFAVIARALGDITAVPAATIRPEHRIVEDLGADGDDLSFVFVPEVERELGVRVDPSAWRSVHRVQDAVDILTAVANARAS